MSAVDLRHLARDRRAEALAVRQTRRWHVAEAQRHLDTATALDRQERALLAEAQDAEDLAK